MRIGFGIPALSFALVWVAASAFSPTKTNDMRSAPRATAPKSVEDLRVPPTTGVRQSLSLSGISALTADECTHLGGQVGDDQYGVCASKKRCATVDNYGNAHSVCLSVAK